MSELPHFQRRALKPVLAGGTSLAILWAFAPTLVFLASRWHTEEYSHGWLIPFLSFFLAAHLWVEKKSPISASLWGVPLMISAGLLLLVGHRAAFEIAGAYGLFLALLSLILSFLGPKVLWTTAPALAYLLFAIPLPRGLQADLSQTLQLFSSEMGVALLDVLGVSVYREGNVIDLGSYRLQVVEACSGLRYLFPLMSFGYLIALLMKDKLIKRVVLFLSTIPLAVGMNALRIGLIGYLTDKTGIAAAQGFMHFFEGWSVFLVCVFVLLAEAGILLRLNPRGHFKDSYLSLPDLSAVPYKKEMHSGKIGSYYAVFALAVGLALFTTANTSTQPKTIILPREPLTSFPLQLDNWLGRTDTLDEETLKSLALTDYFLGNYSREEDKTPVSFYIAFYGNQHTGVTTHSPSLCLPGGGWQTERKWVEEIIPDSGSPFKVTRLLIRKNDHTQMITYWFEERGRKLTSTYEAKWYLLWDSLRTGRSDGALVRFSTPILQGETEQTAQQRSDAFLKQTYPWIGHFIPSETP